MFVTLAVDQFEQSVIIVGFADSKSGCRTHSSRIDTPYVKSFEITDDLGTQMHTWFRSCGLPSSDSHRAVRDVGRELSQMMK